MKISGLRRKYSKTIFLQNCFGATLLLVEQAKVAFPETLHAATILGLVSFDIIIKSLSGRRSNGRKSLRIGAWNLDNLASYAPGSEPLSR